MQFQDFGEERFIGYLTKQFPSTSSITGIGDDCAVIPTDQGSVWLVTTDALVEGVHFLKGQIPPTDLGYKTVAVNVSDIVAMGGEPRYAFLSIALPKDTDSIWAFEVIQGLKEACKKWNVLLLGGDTVGSKRDVFLNLTLVGTASAETIKYRHRAEVGDIICVTGFLGDSAGGLMSLQEGLGRSDGVDYLVRKHFHPDPDVDQGLWLAGHTGVHAMMDVSDGLVCDLSRLIKKSRKGAVIETTKLPISPQLRQLCSTRHRDVLEFALTGGEEYCLLLTVKTDEFESIATGFRQRFGTPLYSIGRITDRADELVYHDNGKVMEMPYKNFDHFK